MEEYLRRTTLLVGEDVQEAICSARVILFGVGGVGGWCAEALVRSGVRDLTTVDFDTVSASNVNRQLMATSSTVGRPKVEALKERLLDVSPSARISALCSRYSEETAGGFALDDYDYVIDAIDSLKDKAYLIRRGMEVRGVFFSSLGAALKLDPTRIRTGNFWKVRDCPLGAALRKKLRREGGVRERSFLCVYGDEVLENRGLEAAGAEILDEEAAASGKAVINGTAAHITAIFGMTLAGLVIRDIYDRTLSQKR